MTVLPTPNPLQGQRKRESVSTPESQREVAQYIADITLDLRNLARAAKMKTLQGLLEMAFYEAYAAANPVIVTQDERERPGRDGARGQGRQECRLLKTSACT